MATGLEHGVILLARVAAGIVFLTVIGLGASGVGGYRLLAETIELASPVLHRDPVPIRNGMFALIGVGLEIRSRPVLRPATTFKQNGIDVSHTW